MTRRARAPVGLDPVKARAGRAGGHARAKSLTPERRREIALNASSAAAASHRERFAESDRAKWQLVEELRAVMEAKARKGERFSFRAWADPHRDETGIVLRFMQRYGVRPAAYFAQLRAHFENRREDEVHP